MTDAQMIAEAERRGIPKPREIATASDADPDFMKRYGDSHVSVTNLFKVLDVFLKSTFDALRPKFAELKRENESLKHEIAELRREHAAELAAVRAEMATHGVACSEDKGVFEAGKSYSAGNGVTADGSFYIAQRATQSAPGPADSSGDWRLAVRRGKQGRDGRPGKDADRSLIEAVVRDVLRDEKLI